jgi:hypothetical protein
MTATRDERICDTGEDRRKVRRKMTETATRREETKI